MLTRHFGKKKKKKRTVTIIRSFTGDWRHACIIMWANESVVRVVGSQNISSTDTELHSSMKRERNAREENHLHKHEGYRPGLPKLEQGSKSRIWKPPNYPCILHSPLLRNIFPRNNSLSCWCWGIKQLTKLQKGNT